MASSPSNPADPPFSITIIGCGLAGSVLALFLSSHHIPVTIYELRPRDAQHGHDIGGSIALAPNALRVLSHLGNDLYARLRAKGYVYEELSFNNGAGRELGRFPNGGVARWGFPALRIPRVLIRVELIAELEARGVEVAWGKRCVGVDEQEGGRVKVEFADGEIITTDLVVGADGIHSHLRKQVAPGIGDPVYSGLTGIGAVVEKAQLADSSAFATLALPAMLYARRNFLAIMPFSPDGAAVSVFVTTELPERPRAEWDALAADQATLRDIFQQYCLTPSTPTLVRQLCEAAMANDRPFTIWPHFTVPTLGSYISREGRGRVVVLGDAAHAIPPTGGQGAAMAFEDAETLAYALSLAVPRSTTDGVPEASPGPSSLSKALQRWEAWRQPRIKHVLAFTTRSGDLRRERSVVEQWIREWGLWIWLSVGGAVMGKGLDKLYGYDARGKETRAQLGGE